MGKQQDKERTMKYDYDYRPDTYWDEKAVETNIAGQWRRERIRQALAEGSLECLPAELFRDHVVDDPDTGQALPAKLMAFGGLLSGQIRDERALAGAFQPDGLGGEYLPSYDDGEVEIARIVLKSVTRDVVSILARPLGDWIAYNVVDEYGWPFHIDIPFSRKPLSFGEMLSQLNNSECRENDEFVGGLILEAATYNVINGAKVDVYCRFADVESPFYPQIRAWVNELWDAWELDVFDEDDAPEGWEEREVKVEGGQWPGLPTIEDGIWTGNDGARISGVVIAFNSDLHRIVARSLCEPVLARALAGDEAARATLSYPQKLNDAIDEATSAILDEMGLHEVLVRAVEHWESREGEAIDLSRINYQDWHDLQEESRESSWCLPGDQAEKVVKELAGSDSSWMLSSPSS